MDMNAYWIEKYVEWKLAQARADAARWSAVSLARAARPGVLAWVGSLLIRIDRRLHGRAAARREARIAQLGMS